MRAHTFDVEIPGIDAWKAAMANVSQTKCVATDRLLKLHRQDLDTMRQAVANCVMHGVRAAPLVFDQGSKDALERVLGFLHSSAPESLDSVKTDDEATAALDHLLSCAPQPDNLGIDWLLPAVQ